MRIYSSKNPEVNAENYAARASGGGCTRSLPGTPRCPVHIQCRNVPFHFTSPSRHDNTRGNPANYQGHVAPTLSSPSYSLFPLSLFCIFPLCSLVSFCLPSLTLFLSLLCSLLLTQRVVEMGAVWVGLGECRYQVPQTSGLSGKGLHWL